MSQVHAVAPQTLLEAANQGAGLECNMPLGGSAPSRAHLHAHESRRQHGVDVRCEGAISTGQPRTSDGWNQQLALTAEQHCWIQGLQQAERHTWHGPTCRHDVVCQTRLDGAGGVRGWQGCTHVWYVAGPEEHGKRVLVQSPHAGIADPTLNPVKHLEQKKRHQWFFFGGGE